ncbi:MAG: DUF4430 domain-containing protein [Oscillospiraceae bacterium]|nr:DUF4430 domain-containing protein [Oscillospiraceae bacterium]
MKKILIILLVTLILFTACALGDTAEIDTSEIPATPIGTGGTTFRFEVIHTTESTSVWAVSTDEATVGAALFEVGIIDDKSFATVVNGIRADYAEDGYWWAFHINGEMALSGMDSTDVEEGKIYALIYTAA